MIVLGGEELLFHQLLDVFADGVHAHTHISADSFIAGVTLIGLAVFAVAQAGVDPFC